MPTAVNTQASEIFIFSKKNCSISAAEIHVIKEATAVEYLSLISTFDAMREMVSIVSSWKVNKMYI